VDGKRVNWQSQLLKIDSVGGLIAGALVLAVSEWLSDLYRIPRSEIVAVGVANLCYGLYSGVLWRMRERPLVLIALLVLANATWAVVCWTAAVRHADSASLIGLAHLIGEGLWVATLAVLEWRARYVLLKS
jgi:hypothetical protein